MWPNSAAIVPRGDSATCVSNISRRTPPSATTFAPSAAPSAAHTPPSNWVGVAAPFTTSASAWFTDPQLESFQATDVAKLALEIRTSVDALAGDGLQC